MFVFLPPREFMAKAARRRAFPKQRSLFVEAARLEQDFARQLGSDLRALRGDISLEALTRVLPRARIDQVLEVVDAAGIKATFVDLKSLFKRGGAAGARTAGREMGKAAVVDPLRDRIAAWADKHGAELVRQTVGTSRDAIKAMVRAGVERGRHPARLAADIRSVVGLTEPQAAAVTRRRDGLLSKGIEAGRANAITDAYAEKLLDHRAWTIARNESLTAINRGRLALWEQLVEDGAMPKGQEQEWQTSEDEAVCEICGPMNRQRKRMGEPFVLPTGEQILAPPAHVQCRCTAELV